MGRPTEHSDYDCALIVAGEAIDAFRAEFGIEGFALQDGLEPDGVDLIAVTFPMFEAIRGLEPGTANQRGHRYAFAHLKALVDKTGRAQPLIDAKACVPADAVDGFIHGSLDHALNQAYRALKCLRDGDPAASRLEAAEGVNPFVDAVFALHGGRLRPFYKYLRWELEAFPLDRLTFGGVEMMDRLAAVLSAGRRPGAARAARGRPQAASAPPAMVALSTAGARRWTSS